MDAFESAVVSAAFVGTEIYEHITLQETAAAADGIVETVLRRGLKNCVILARIDATAAVKYIACLGGRKATFTNRIRHMQQLLRERHIMQLATHIKGEENPADAPSRRHLQIAEFKLSTACFEMLRRRWGPIGLDACAASWNFQVKRYLSRQYSDIQAVGHDVLTHPMQTEKEVVYVFPPTQKKLILEIIQRIKSARTEAILVVPI